MNTRKTIYLSILFCSWCLMGFTWGDMLSRKTQKGNELFEAGRYEDALQAFTEADVHSTSSDPRLPKLYKNMGNTYAKLGKYEQAAAMYQKALEASGNAAFQADVQYNAGNAWFKQHQYQQALESYKQALELNPKHKQSQKNKELVEKLIVQQQQQQQKNQQNKQDQQQQNQQNQQNQQDKKDQQQKQDQQKQQEQKEQQQEQKQPQDQKQQTADQAEKSPEDKQQQLSKEEALRILDALKEKEQLPQQQVQAPPRPVEKDW